MLASETAVASSINSKHFRKVWTRQKKRRRLWSVDHLLTSSTMSQETSKLIWKDFKSILPPVTANDEDNAAKRWAMSLTSIGVNSFRVLKDLALPNVNSFHENIFFVSISRSFKTTRLKIVERYRTFPFCCSAAKAVYRYRRLRIEEVSFNMWVIVTSEEIPWTPAQYIEHHYQ